MERKDATNRRNVKSAGDWGRDEEEEDDLRVTGMGRDRGAQRRRAGE